MLRLKATINESKNEADYTEKLENTKAEFLTGDGADTTVLRL